MKGILLFLIASVMATSSFAQDVRIDRLRYLYFEAWVETCGAEELVEYTESLGDEAPPVFRAYRGAGLATTANCTSWPLAKLSRFRDGKELLEEAITEVPENLEVRFLRYTIQKNIPGFLNYDNLDEDRKFILDRLTLQLKSGNKDELSDLIVNYLYDSKELTKEQVQDLESASSEE